MRELNSTKDNEENELSNILLKILASKGKATI